MLLIIDVVIHELNTSFYYNIPNTSQATNAGKRPVFIKILTNTDMFFVRPSFRSSDAFSQLLRLAIKF